MQDVCLGCVNLPKIGQIYFHIIKQKFIQRSETKIDADACKASYKILCLSLVTNTKSHSH